jgi:hypothetical protein
LRYSAISIGTPIEPSKSAAFFAAGQKIKRQDAKTRRTEEEDKEFFSSFLRVLAFVFGMSLKIASSSYRCWNIPAFRASVGSGSKVVAAGATQAEPLPPTSLYRPPCRMHGQN